MKKLLALVAGFAVLAAVAVWWMDHTATATGIDVSNVKFVAQGRALYAKECAACHGKNLEGQIRDWRSRLPDGSLPAPPHDATGHTWHHPDSLLFEITKLGRLKASGGAARSNMPGFEDKLSDEEIWAVLSFIKSQWPDSIRRRHDQLNLRAQGQ